MRYRTRRSRYLPALGIAGLLLGAFAVGVGVHSVRWASAAHASVPAEPAPAKHCDIKGNISITTGERIYHIPGQEYYDATRISPQYGERWFCSEAQARTAGWRKARR